jgi:tetratricopeptide (TPR) repeat protein
MFWRRGKYEAAEEMSLRALKGREKVPGPKHYEALLRVTNLAGVLRDQGKYEAAKEMYQQALDIKRKVLRTEHSSRLFSINGLAVTLRCRV